MVDALVEQKEAINKSKGEQRQQQAGMNANLNQTKKGSGYTSEAGTDERIAQVERQMVTVSMPLKQGEDLINGISDLK